MKLLLVIFAFSVLMVTPVRAQTIPTSITLTWTAPGDDGDVGTAKRYEMRWSTSKPDTTKLFAWWDAATVFAGMPVPTIAGTTQTVAFAPPSGFTFDTSYYFIVRAVDNANNIAPYSNVALFTIPDTLPPAQIKDLR